MKSGWIEKKLRISLTRSARKALTQRQAVLVAEMELLFSCIVRKRVYFGEPDGKPFEQINEKLGIRFSPLVGSSCQVSGQKADLPVGAFPLTDAARFLPKWLIIDFRNGQWAGKFGY